MIPKEAFGKPKASVAFCTNKKTRPAIFWGWWIVAVSFLSIFMFFGARHAFGVFLVPMCKDMGWSRGELSFAFMAMMWLYGIASIVWGRLADRYSPRATVSIAAIIGFIGYGLTAFVKMRWHLLITYSQTPLRLDNKIIEN
ncbi:MAG: MFS transporter [Candidatus Poribacteria bacterium]